jgi:hypothetical protein
MKLFKVKSSAPVSAPPFLRAPAFSMTTPVSTDEARRISLWFAPPERDLSSLKSPGVAAAALSPAGSVTRTDRFSESGARYAVVTSKRVILPTLPLGSLLRESDAHVTPALQS